MVKPQPWSQSRIFQGVPTGPVGRPRVQPGQQGPVHTPQHGSRAGPSSWAAGLSASQRLASASREPVSGPGRRSCGLWGLSFPLPASSGQRAILTLCFQSYGV